MGHLRQIAPNTIPPPPEALLLAEETLSMHPDVSRDDRFPKGKIIKYFPNLSYGFVLDQNGRELFFHVEEVDLLGPRGKRQWIQIGAEVGYDCCRTSHGLRVKRMKIY
jgi:cold shock CspA family protein